MEELPLRPILARDELDIVDEQDVDRPVARSELLHPVTTNRGDQLVCEALGRQVEEVQRRMLACDLVADGAKQVRFAEAGAPMQKQRSVGARGKIGDRLAGGVGELVTAAYDEGREG